MHYIFAILSGYFVTAVIIVAMTLFFTMLLNVPMTSSKAPPMMYLIVNVLYGWIGVIFGSYTVVYFSEPLQDYSNVAYMGYFMTILSSYMLFTKEESQPTWYRIMLVFSPLVITSLFIKFF
jgi:hypothetical protein